MSIKVGWKVWLLRYRSMVIHEVSVECIPTCILELSDGAHQRVTVEGGGGGRGYMVGQGLSYRAVVIHEVSVECIETRTTELTDDSDERVTVESGGRCYVVRGRVGVATL